MLANLGVSAFIQSPIPPSTKNSYFRDVDGDGRLDQVEIKFLGGLSEEYLNQMVDSLTLDWLDSSGNVVHLSVTNRDMEIDSLDSRLLRVSLDSRQGEFMAATSLMNWDYAGAFYGNAALFVGDSVKYDLEILDGMAPMVRRAELKSYRGQGVDSLLLYLTETTIVDKGCAAFLEFKSAKDNKIRVVMPSSVTSNFWGNEMLLEFALKDETSIWTRDSLRILPGCARDSAGNVNQEQSRFLPIKGYFPFSVNVANLVKTETIKVDEKTPIFQMVFEDAKQEPRDSLWRVSMELMGAEFENALRVALNEQENFVFQKNKLKLSAGVKIYTNLGSYVVGTKMTVTGDDSRFVYSPTRLSLRWNMMDGYRRLVSTGVYLAHVSIVVEYDGRVIFRNEGNVGRSGHVFGVRHR